MDKQTLIPFPVIPVNPGDWGYFWHQLPYAFPGVLTFIVGLFLFILGSYAAFNKERRSFYISFAITCLGFGFLGLVLALRAVILDRAFLLNVNIYLYFFVLLMAPANYLLIYYITEKKYRILLWFSSLVWIATLIGYAGLLGEMSILPFKAFTGVWLEYSFGNYPVADLALKPWGILSAVGYFVVALPTYYVYLKKNKSKNAWVLLMGHNLLIILTLSNLPSFLGYPIFPGANFSFIAMLILAYGVFRSDFLNLNDLMFKKNGLFYTINIMLMLVFLMITILVSYHLSPAHYASLNWFPWLLLPLASMSLVFGLAILVAGTNPSARINQIGALAICMYGFQLIGILSVSLNLEPIVAQRIKQLVYVIFCLAPSVQVRFAFLALNKKSPRYIYLFDVASILMSLFALSPYLFIGYYSYEFGNMSAGGPVINVLGFTGFAAVFVILQAWWKSRKEKPSRLGNFMVLYIVTGTVLLISNLPSTMGFALYPFGNLVIIPTGILAYAILKFGVLPMEQQALKINHRMSGIVFLLTPLFFILYYPVASNQASNANVLLHMLLVGSPFLLLSYQLTFLLTRPISEKLDITYAVLAEERLQAETERGEILKLNNFSKALNETTELDIILDNIYSYMVSEFNIEGMFLTQINESSKEFYISKIFVPPAIDPAQIKWLKEQRFPMEIPGETRLSSWMFTYKLKKPFHQKNIRKTSSKLDNMLVDRLQFKSFLQVPLILHDKVIAIVNFIEYEKEMNLSKTDIASISRFCEQITGAIHSSSLFKQVQKEQIKSENQRLIAVKIKKEVENLNQIMSEIGDLNDLHDIMNHLISFISSNYGLKYYSLYFADKSGDTIKFFSANFPDWVTEKEKKRMSNASIPITQVEGAFALAYKRRKITNFPLVRASSALPEEQFVIQAYRMQSFLAAPLITQGKLVGFINFSNISRLSINKDQINKIGILAEHIGNSLHNSKLMNDIRVEKLKSEETRRQLSKLNNLSKAINDTSDLYKISKEIQAYLQEEKGAATIWLLLTDFDKNELFTHSIRFDESLELEDHLKSNISRIRIPLEPESGMLYVTYQKKKVFSLSQIKKSWLTNSPVDKQIVESLSLKSFAHLPLVVRGKVIGILALSLGQDTNFQKNDREWLEPFSEQIAGAVNNAHLFAEVKNAREIAEHSRMDAEIARQASEIEQRKSDHLLLNILPEKVANELKQEGKVEPLFFDSATVLFTDFVGFTKISETMLPDELIRELDGCFTQFDEIVERNNLEKLKTIGDAYMCAGGLPEINNTHPVDTCMLALELQAFMNQMSQIKKEMGLPFWELRLGINTGSVIAGVVGKNKFAYDIWGDTVNTASRMESSGAAGKINISANTYQFVKEFFDCEYRGKISAKGKGEIDMYFINNIKPELSKDVAGMIPNNQFHNMYKELTQQQPS